MQNGFFCSIVVTAAGLLLMAGPAPAQPPGGRGGRGGGGFNVFGGPRMPPVKPGPVPRLADGKPDMQGYWNAANNGGAVFEIQKHEERRQGVPPGNGAIVDPPDGMIPYRPWAAAKAKDTFEHHMSDEPELHCDESGVPKQIYVQFGFQIFQPANYMVMTWEFMHAYRIIPTDGRPHTLPADVHLYQGDSVGHWEGDTLVVDTTNLNGRTWLDTVGNFHSDALHVVERFTMKDSETIDYEATLTDPKTYTRPWTIAFPLRRNRRPDYQQMEFACVEGNEDVHHYTPGAGIQ